MRIVFIVFIWFLLLNDCSAVYENLREKRDIIALPRPLSAASKLGLSWMLDFPA